MVEAELAGGNVQEAFRHLKGWHQATPETQTKPCYHTLERQTLERVDLYALRESPGDPLPINVAQVKINDDVPPDGELRQVVGELTNGQKWRVHPACTSNTSGSGSMACDGRRTQKAMALTVAGSAE